MRSAWWTRWRREGFVETASAEDADLVILNTCHIREKASEKVYSELGRLRVMKEEAARQGRQMNIAVAGCVAQAEGEEIIRRAPVVDVVVGPQSYHHLPQLLARPKPRPRAGNGVSGRGQVRLPAAAEAGRDPRARHFLVRHRAGRLRQVLHVLRGAVTRGAEVSRPVAKIIDDVAARRQWRARNHPDRAERQRLSRRGTRRASMDAGQACCIGSRQSRRREVALFHQPSLRHGRQPDRGRIAICRR